MAVVALILLALLWWLSRSIGGSKQQTGVPAGETLTAEEMKSLDEAATENANFKKRQIRLAKIHARQEAIAARVDRSLTLLTELEAARQKWEAELKELPTNAQGRFIASRDEAVSAFVREREVPHVSAREIETTKQGLQNLLKPIDEARADQESLLEVDSGTTKELAEAHQWITASLGAFQKSIDLIEGLIAEGQKGTPSRWTLQEAIEKRNAFYAAQNAAFAHPIEEEAKREEAKQNARLLEEREASARFTELIRRDRERTRVAALAPETLKKFRPFLGKGRVDVEGFHCAPACLVSYRMLKSMGALDNWENFMEVASNPADEWRTPRWESPRSEADKRKAQKLLEEFLDLAEVWIEEGYLAR